MRTKLQSLAALRQRLEVSFPQASVPTTVDCAKPLKIGQFFHNKLTIQKNRFHFLGFAIPQQNTNSSIFPKYPCLQGASALKKKPLLQAAFSPFFQP